MALKYDQLLTDIPEIEIIKTYPNCYNSRHLYQIAVENRDNILDYFNNNDIYPGVHYQDNTEYPMYSYANGTCPRAKYYSDRIISLPLHLNLDNKDLERVVTILIKGMKMGH